MFQKDTLHTKHFMIIQVVKMPQKKHKFWFNNLSAPHKVLVIAGVIVVAGMFFPPNNPITPQIYSTIFNAIADPIIAQQTKEIAPTIGAEALSCIEQQRGTYNFKTLTCDLP